MASNPVPPITPSMIFVDPASGRLTREGYEFLHNMRTLLNQVRAAMITAGFPP